MSQKPPIFYDLILRNGTVLDPAQGLHDRRDVAVTDGRVAAIEPDLSTAPAARVIDAGDHLITPGLIDLHTHVYAGVSLFGIEPDVVFPPTGVTTAVDAGTAGPRAVPPVAPPRLRAWMPRVASRSSRSTCPVC